MEIVKKILAERHPGKVFTIPSNGHFDTTEGNIKQMGSILRNLNNKELLYAVNEGGAKPIGGWFHPFGKWVYVPLCIVALVFGAILGGIG